MSIDRKCDRFGFGYPTPCTIARSPLSYMRFQTGQIRMQADIIVDFQNLIRRMRDVACATVIDIIAVGNDGAQPVIAAGKLHHDQDLSILARGLLGGLNPADRSAPSRSDPETSESSARPPEASAPSAETPGEWKHTFRITTPRYA